MLCSRDGGKSVVSDGAPEATRLMQRIGRSLLFGQITPNVSEERPFILTPSLTPHLANSSNGQSCVAWDLCAAPTLGFGSLGQVRQESADLMGVGER